MRKALILFLALITLTSVIACAKEGEVDDVTTQPISLDTSEETDDNLDPQGYEKDSLPDNLNYNTDVNVLHWNDYTRPEFGIEKTNGDVTNDAVFNRNLQIEDRLGVKLVWHGQPGNVSNTASFVSTVQKSYMAGDHAYDIIATYSRTAGMLAVDGYLANINEIEDSYLDFDKPWWPDNMVDTMTIGNAVYFITGDAATSVLHYMTAIFYNKEQFVNLDLQFPAEDVRNDTWTFDKLITVTSNQYVDLDSNGRQSESDFYGFTTIYYNADAFYSSSNLKLVDSDPDNLIKISDDFFSEKAINLIDKLGPWMMSDTCYISRSGSAVTYHAPFANGNALTCQLRAFMVAPGEPTSLTDVSWEYGIVPNPKYDENQEDYYTILGNPFTLIGIIKSADDQTQTMCSAVLECWGSEAYRNSTPALFEICMKLKYSATETEAEMYDVVRGSIVFDLGRIFSEDLSRMSEKPSISMTTAGSWAATSKQLQRVLTTQLKKITDSLIGQQG